METAFPSSEALDSNAFLDGWQNTLLLAEVNDDYATIWSKPEDYHLARAKVQDDLFRLRGDGCFGVFGGTTGVRLIPANIDDDSLLAIFTPGGREGIGAMDVTREPRGAIDTTLIADLEQNPLPRQPHAQVAARVGAAEEQNLKLLLAKRQRLRVGDKLYGGR